MTKHILGLVLAAALIAPLAGLAQTPPSPGPAAPARAKRLSTTIQGQVAAVDIGKNTVTLSGRRGSAATTLTLAPGAKVYVTKPAVLSDIKIGDTLDAYAANLTAGAVTVTPTRIFISIPPAATTRKPAANTGFHRTYVQGVVLSTAPALTMKTAGGVTVTVTTTTATPVTRLTPTSLASVVVGAAVQVRTNGDAANPMATELRVMPVRQTGGTPTPATVPAPVVPAQ